jgi:hypothetical protein
MEGVCVLGGVEKERKKKEGNQTGANGFYAFRPGTDDNQ